MPQNINLDVRPYYDDFTTSQKYYRILFKPGFAVQARELTQIQSGIQNQIEQFGKHIFVNGTKVLDANSFFESNLVSIKLENQFNSLDIDLDNFIGKNVTGQTSGCVGIVKEIIKYSGIDSPNKIIIQILSGHTFVASEEIWTDDTPVPYKSTVKANGVLQAITPAMRYSVTAGVFFVNGFFVYSDSQSIILDSETNTSSHSVGFDITESFVGADTDVELLDPANGSSNYAAPGADRLSIELTLSFTDLTNTKTNYLEIARVESGVITFEATRTVYAEIEKELARRTFDESGNYSVKNFGLSLVDHFTQAKATINLLSGVVTSIDIDAAGIKFDDVPTIEIVGDGTGSTATILLDNNPVSATYKEISSVTVNTGGSGYTEAFGLISGDPSKFMCKLDPGKAYVKGFEFETIVPSYIETTKPRTVDIADNLDVNVSYANFIYVENLNYLFDPNSLEIVNLHKVVRASAASGNKIGQARVRMTKLLSGIPGSTTETYKVSIFEIQMDRKVLISVSWSAGAATFNSTAHGFTAGQSIVIRGDSNYNGAYVVLASPAPDANHFSVALESDLGAVSATATAENLFKDLESIVSPATTKGGDVSLLSKTGGSPTADVFLSGSDANSLVFPLNNTWVKTIRDALNDAQSDYTFQSVFDSVSFTAGVATISTANGLERFFGGVGALTDNIKDNYYIGIVTAVGTSAFTLNEIIRFDTGSGRSISLSTPSVGVSQQATFNANVGTNFTLKILATINANTQTEKVKALQNYTYVIISSPNDIVSLSDSLGIADIKSLKAVYNCSTNDPTGQVTLNATTGDITSWGTVPVHLDVTSSYILDNGQRDSIYDHGGIILQSDTVTASTDYLVAVFNYYTHTGSGFLSVDSYSEGYVNIPKYISSATGLEYNLRDCIDFRPRRNDNATTFTSVKFPDSDFTFNTDYQYYLPRVDRLFALSDKTFMLSRGIANLSPVPPPVGGDDSMLLYTLVIPPYLVSLSDVQVYYHDNRRFTMSDIGDLEKRIKRLEYYASLTLLEQQARDVKITDSNNLDKFKNGFFVDPFVGHFIGEIGAYNYRCSIDPQKQELRALNYTAQLDFETFQLTSCIEDSSRITLDYTEEIVLEQLYASSALSVNPYNIITYVGYVDMNPPSDSWEETKILPTIVNTVNVTNVSTNVVSAIKASTVNNTTNIITSVPIPSNSQKQFLATNQTSGATAYVFNPATASVTASNGTVINGVNAQVVNNFLGR
jgi:hypothetical protein